MDFDRRAQDVIEGAEKALAALAAEAASERDYPRASMLLGLAQRVAGTVRPGGGLKQDVQPPSTAGAMQAAVSGSPMVKKSTMSSKTTEYPRFKRENDTLIKVGWSKSDRSTYEHRSPRAILDRLVMRIVEVGSSGERFTTEEILPLLDERNSELPSYQAYLCLAWLVIAGLLERHGRQGYTVAVAGDFQHAVETQWEQLPSR